MIFLTVVLGIAYGKLYNLEDDEKFTISPGESIEINARSEYNKAHTWIVEEIDSVKLTVQHLKPKKGKNKFGTPKFSAFSLTCSRDCVPGEGFDLTFKYKDMKAKEIKDTKTIRIEVVQSKEDL